MSWKTLAVILFLLWTSAIAQAQEHQPNIIVLLADDLGYGELGCQGNPEIPTPHIDAIASHGIRFTQGYVTAPNCSPSRAGLLTGKIPTRFGYEFNPIGAGNEAPGAGMPGDEITLAELLHDVGYTTGLIGKWHQGASAPYHPYRHGFDEFFGFMHEGHYFVPPPYRGVTTMLRRRALPGNQQGRWVSDRLIFSTHMGHDEPDYDANNPIIRGGQPIVEQEYLTVAFTREALDFIDRNADKPFFLYLAYNAVHSPLQGADEDMQKFKTIGDVHRRIFAAMLSKLDDSVGAVLEKVAEKQLAEQTLIFFLSDNGGPTRELTSSNLPLRGEKGSLYEGGLRVPFMVTWPGHLAQGNVDERPISSMDIYATAAELAGAKINHEIDGVNLLPYLTNAVNARPHEEFFWRQGNRTALRVGDWKLVNQRHNSQSSRWELYNLADDLSEQRDVASEQEELVEDMISRWNEYNSQMREPLF